MVKRKNHLLSVEGLIEDDSRLRLLYRESCRRSELNQTIAEQLPDSLKEHVFPVMQDGELFLFVPNNAVAQIVRFQSKLLQQCAQATKVIVRIDPTLAPAPPKEAKTIERVISSESAQVIREFADLVDDTPLRNAMLRLASLAQE